MLEVNCKECRYRFWLAECGVHEWATTCDQYGTDLCKKMNDPEFIEFMKTKGADHGTE